MNSLANLNAVVDEQGNPTTWPSNGWDQPVTTISAAAMPDTRLHDFHPSPIPRQDWDWPDNPILLASHEYSAQEHQIECKPHVMQVEALGGGGRAGLRQYNGVFTAADLPAMVTAQNSWPSVLNATTIRQNMGLESSSGSYSPSFYEGLGGGGGNLAGMGAGYGPAASSVNNYLGIGEARTALEQRHSHLLGLANIDHGRIHDILKRGMYTSRSGGTPDFSTRIGLNLGGRTYFSTEDSSYTLARFGKRFRPNSPSMHVPLCQAEGCKADLSIAKHYHRRHKVCDYHSKAATVIINGNTQRFCQQCSRFHALSEFDEGKRSCRKRLADHNRRRRKPQSTPSTATGTATATPMASSNTDSTLKLNDDESQAAEGPGRSEEQASGQKKEAAMAASSEQTPSLLSEMSLAPSVSLTLQNGGREMQAMTTSKNNEEEPAYESQPYLLNGPSLSLSNIAAQGGGTTPSHQQGQSPPQNFGEVELSVPWLRATHVGSSTRMALMQESLGRSDHQAKEGSMSNSTSHANGEHSRLLAEHMQSLRSQARSSRDHHLRHHQMHGKTENWVLDSAVVEEGQTVLSLVETASNTDKDNHHHHHQQHHHSAFNAEAQENAGTRPPLGFLQQHGGQLNSPSDMNHEASDAALSLHRMQVLRPLNESLYTTADFMKDGFV